MVWVGYLTGSLVTKKMVALVFRLKGPRESHVGVCVGKEVCEENLPQLLSHRTPSFPQGKFSFHPRKREAKRFSYFHKFLQCIFGNSGSVPFFISSLLQMSAVLSSSAGEDEAPTVRI